MIFKFHNEIFKSAIKKSIEVSIKEDAYKYLLNESNKDAITYGIFEEKLLILIISYNKLGLNDLIFCDENKFEIEEINKFRDSCFKKTKQKYIKMKPILITQMNFLGQNYDLLILIPNSTENYYIAYLIQIGKNKTRAYIEKIINELKKDEQAIIGGIEKFIDCNISKIELVFIFDKETQINEINNGGFSGAQYCVFNKILFYLFSLDDYLLYSTSDMFEFHLVNNFTNQIGKINNNSFLCNVNFQGKNPKIKKRTYNDLNDSNYILSFLNLEEIELINSIIENDIFNNYIVDSIYSNQKINNLKDCDINKIYIYDQGNNRYYIIKKSYYINNGGAIENIAKSYVFKDNNFQLKILTPKNINVFRKKFKSQ